jgi:hypothetical protein
MKRAPLILLFAIAIQPCLSGQALGFSIATDFGLQRSFKKDQRFWAVGHTVQAQFHFAPRDVVYLWMSYYTEGEFSNRLTATAKSPIVIPQTITYNNDASMRFKQFSVGFKKYLRGRFDAEENWNLYVYGGFGLVLGRVINAHNPPIDSNDYDLPVREGKANFKRLTLDLGAGAEYPIGADIFLYTEVRAWVPTTDYPSKHIFVNENAPLAGMLNVGIRILF